MLRTLNPGRCGRARKKFLNQMNPAAKNPPVTTAEMRLTTNVIFLSSNIDGGIRSTRRVIFTKVSTNQIATAPEGVEAGASTVGGVAGCAGAASTVGTGG